MSDAPAAGQSRWNILTPRGRLARVPYIIIVVVCALALITGRLLSGLGTAGSWIALLVYVLAIWCLFAAMMRRLLDAGISSAWLIGPLVISVIAFAWMAYTYQPPPLVPDATPLMKFLAFITIVPAMLSAVAWLLAKILAGVTAALAVWGVVVLLLLLPASTPTDKV